MRFCHECGAIVAPEDTFCSYCGISLQPTAAATAPDSAAAPEIAAPIGGSDTTAAQTFGSQPLETPSRIAAIESQTDLAIKAAMRFESKPSTDQINSIDADAADAAANPAQNRAADSDAKTAENRFAHGGARFDSSSAPNDATLVERRDESNVDAFGDEPNDEPPTVISQQIPIFNAPQAESNSRAAAPAVQPNSAGESPSDFAKLFDNLQKDLLSESTDASSAVPNAVANPVSPLAVRAISAEDLQETLIGQRVNFDLPHSASEPTAAAGSNEIAPSKAKSGNIASEPVIEPASEKIESIALAANQAAAADTADKSERAASPEIASAKTDAESARNAAETPGGKSPKLKPLADHTLLNRRYEIVRRIGGGGMGAVYLAKDQNLGGVQRAVKEMIQAYVDESQQEKAVQDFRRESILLSQLEHPAIPTIYDYFYDEEAGRFYLVMKYIAGGDLSGKLRAAAENRLDEGSVTEWAMQIADVLHYLHNQQPPIVYRDLKPSNIMLDAVTNKAMLIDFGIARFVKKEEKGVTAVGTMGYAPPELFAGNAEPRSDLYSLGATMFHLLTGADPQSNPLLIFDFTKNPRPRDVNPNLSVEIEDILLRAVEYNAALRFESAARMRDALAEHLERLKAGRLTFERRRAPIAAPPSPPQRQPMVAPPASANLVFCGFCGEKIVATDMFCAYCGAPQQNAQPPAAGNSKQLEQTMLSVQLPAAAGKSENLAASSSAATARLVVLGTQQLSEPIFQLEKDNNLIGREDRRSNIFPEIDLTRYDDPEDARISRRHARIWREGAGYLIEDLKSANGTILIGEDNNAVRLQPNQPHVLNHGDKLKLGKTTLRFYAN